MPKLLLNLRNVPDDEGADVVEFLNAHDIEWYQTKPSVFGISAGGIWLRNPDEYAKARELMTDYQSKRQARVRAEHEEARRNGTAPTFWGEIRRNPRQGILTLIAVAIACAVAAWPFLLI